MENREIADRLEELADLLEIGGANPFRVRAYRNAIRLVRGLTRPVAGMVAAEEDLTELPGIGEDLAARLVELVTTGELALLQEVTGEVPRELALLTRIEGLGPKKVARLWKELGVTSLESLEAAAEGGDIAGLEGFGDRSQEKILRGISELRSRAGRFLRREAEEALAAVRTQLEGHPAIDRLEGAGSWRRGAETVGDLDVLVTLRPGSEGMADEVMERFTGTPGVDRVEATGSTKGRIVLRSGLPVDLRILAAESWGAALHHFTGSKEHNVGMRGRARDLGLRISEYGVFRGEERVGGRTEDEVFRTVGLPWIPPELREGRGELEAAAEGQLPELVRLEDLRGDLHMHTTWSDGAASIEEMALACRERGYEYLAITDHSRAVTVAGGLTPEQILEQADEVAAVRERVEGIHLLHGCEVDILKDGTLDLPDDVLERLDVVLVAVHSHFGLGEREQTDRILRALEHPRVDILVHPTGRLLQRREPYAVDVEAVLEGAARHDVAVEVNANPRRLDLHDRHLFRARELGVRVSIATDAHAIGALDQIRGGVLQARRGWLGAGDVLNALPASELATWLGRRGRTVRNPAPEPARSGAPESG